MSAKKITWIGLWVVLAVGFAALAFSPQHAPAKSKAQRLNVSKNIVQRL